MSPGPIKRERQVYGRTVSREELDRANRVIQRYRALRAQGWESFDAMLRARAEESATEWLSTLPFGEVVDPEPGHVRLAAHYHGERAAEEMVYCVRVAQEWAPVFGFADFADLGQLTGQCISRKYYGQSPSRR